MQFMRSTRSVWRLREKRMTSREASGITKGKRTRRSEKKRHRLQRTARQRAAPSGTRGQFVCLGAEKFGMLCAGLAEETAPAGSAAAAQQKNDPDTVKAAVTAVVSASASAKAAAAAAQDQDDPDQIAAASESASVITVASASTVGCCQITHICSSKICLHCIL